MDTQLARPPSLMPLYAKALLRRGSATSLPDTTLALSDQPIDTDRLRRYQQVCGYRVSDLLPPAYPHLMAFPLSMALMTGADFPFPLLGLVHVENELVQHRPITAAERLTVRCWAENLREHPSGRSVDLVGEASVGDEPVWREVSTYLHRERSSNGKHDRPVPVPG
ncbi:MAG TPA: hypothetical protein VMB79_04085, partial [Jatrophihabitans sp.]|nr:hypothetical protein [Jatrophihabitans sp.]